MIQENKIQETTIHKNMNEPPTETKFSKEQLLAAKCFQNRKDIVDALLVQDKQYTIKDVEEKIASFMKGKVK